MEPTAPAFSGGKEGDTLQETDSRAKLTKSLIRQAFTGLLQQKPIQHITVKEI